MRSKPFATYPGARRDTELVDAEAWLDVKVNSDASVVLALFVW
jgi:hypothetical protein